MAIHSYEISIRVFIATVAKKKYAMIHSDLLKMLLQIQNLSRHIGSKHKHKHKHTTLRLKTARKESKK